MKLKRTFSLLLVVACLLLVLAGCQTNEEKITIDLLTWHGPDSPTSYYDGYEQVIKDYVAKHKNVTINIKYEEDETYGNILETGFAGGTAPDIIQMKSAQRATFSNNLLDMRSYLNEANPYDTRNAKWIDNFIGGEAAFPAEKTDTAANAFLFVPNDSNPEVYTGGIYLFNKDLIVKAGLDPANPPKDWKDLFTWLDTLSQNGEIAPIAGSSDVGGKVSQIGYGFGEKYADKFFDDEITNPEFAGDLWWDKLYVLTCYDKGSTMPLDNLPYYPAMMKLMQKHLSFYQASWFENSPETEILTFASGKAAMIVTAFWGFDTLASSLSTDKFPQGYGLFPVPYFGADTLAYAVSKGWITQEEADAAAPYAVDRPSTGGGTGAHDYGFTVNKKTSENPEKLAAVVDFLRFLSSKDVQDKYVETAKSLSPVKDVKLIDMMKNFMVAEPANGFATDVLGYTVVEWGKSGWDVDVIKFLKNEQDWQTTVTNVSAPEWVNDIPALADLEAAVATAKTELDGAAEGDKEAKQRAYDYAVLRLKLYRDYYYEKTGDLVEIK